MHICILINLPQPVHIFNQNIQTITIMKSNAYGISNLLHVSSIKEKLIKENIWYFICPVTMHSSIAAILAKKPIVLIH